jgi:TolA-binding protein
MFYLKIFAFLLIFLWVPSFANNLDYSTLDEKLSIIYGKLEVLENKIDKLSKGNTNVSSEKRVKNTETLKSTLKSSMENSITQNHKKSSLVLENDLGETEEEKSYKYLIHLIKIKRIDEAREQLRNFTKSFPNSDLIAGICYSLGEISFNQGDYKQASVDFLKGYKSNKNHENTPLALIKLVTSLRNIEQYEHACAILSKVEKDYQNVNAIKSNLRIEKKALSDFCN